jgi:pimeloyl-ACP methyl ester carboxylesterase
MSDDTSIYRDVFYRSADGLKLYARDYGDRLSPWLPVVCLAGLTRTSRDFDALAVHFVSHRHRPRRVVAFDYRGRGRSEWDSDTARYNPVTEMNDVLDGMATLGIPRAVVVGTSRGGIIGMLMGIARPATLAGLVLVDVGPALEPRGLARIKTYVGRTPTPQDWADAASIQRRLHGGQFNAWDDADWDALAHATYAEKDGRPVPDYDAKGLAATFTGAEIDQPIPTLWDEFRALKGVKIQVIWGERTDLLSAATVAEMQRIHPSTQVVKVIGEGHPPRLAGGALLGKISAFITGIEGAAPPVDAVIPRQAAAYDLDA